MTERVILTEQRERLLSGKYEGSDTAERAQRHRLKNSTKVAIDELIQIAESPVLDNSDVFDPDDVFRLLRALYTPSQDHLEEESGLIDHGDATPEYRAYTDRLYVQIDKVIRDYQTSEKAE
jgi:hypothetical protein